MKRKEICKEKKKNIRLKHWIRKVMISMIENMTNTKNAI